MIKNANEGSGYKNEELNLISRTHVNSQAYLYALLILAVESQKWVDVSQVVSLSS